MNSMRNYFLYYAVWTALAYLVRQPILLAGLVLVFLLRDHLPDPAALWNATRRKGRLEQLVHVNPHNVVARRDLGTIYLDLRRPKKAVDVLAPAIERHGDDAELAYLYGLALHRASRSEEALPYFVKSVEERAIRYGEPYAAAGDALFALGRVDGAIDAYERYASINHSDVAVHARLARAHAEAGDAEAVRASLAKGLETFHHLPGSMRRRALGAFVEVQWLRARWLRAPDALFGFLAVLVLGGVLAYGVASYLIARPPLGGRGASADPAGPTGSGRLAAPSDAQDALLRAFARCGHESTAPFAGRYVVVVHEHVQSSDASTERESVVFVLPDRIQHRRVFDGVELVHDHCITRVIRRTSTSLWAEAVEHEDLDDAGDAALVEIRLERTTDGLRFARNEPGQPALGWETWRRTQ